MKLEMKGGSSCASTNGVIVASRPTTNVNDVGTFIFLWQKKLRGPFAQRKQEKRVRVKCGSSQAKQMTRTNLFKVATKKGGSAFVCF